MSKSCPCRQWARYSGMKANLPGHHPSCDGEGGHVRTEPVIQQMKAILDEPAQLDGDPMVAWPPHPTILDTESATLAYPDGYLCGWGVQTVGGWTCVWDKPVNGKPRHIWRFSRFIEVICEEGKWSWWKDEAGWAEQFTAESWAANGSLLPELATENTGTWAVALVDLANAVGLPLDPGEMPWLHPSAGPPAWALSSRQSTRLLDFKEETTDIVEAMVYGRIWAHGEAKR